MQSDNRDVQIGAAEALVKIAPVDRAGTLTEKLLQILRSTNVGVTNESGWGATAEALAKIAPPERAVEVIDKFLPLLEPQPKELNLSVDEAAFDWTVRSGAAEVLAKAGPSNIRTATRLLRDIYDRRGQRDTRASRPRAYRDGGRYEQ